MGFGVNEVQRYVNYPIGVNGRSNIGAVRANHYVKDLGALNRYNSLDRTYGQSPRVEDDANAGKLLGVPRLHEIVVC